MRNSVANMMKPIAVSAVAADGTVPAQAPVELRHTTSLQKPVGQFHLDISVQNASSACTVACEQFAGDEIYYDASETLSDYGTDLFLPAH